MVAKLPRPGQASPRALRPERGQVREGPVGGGPQEIPQGPGPPGLRALLLVRAPVSRPNRC